MIVTRTEVGLRLVTQPDHARLAAEILALWRSDGLPTHPRRKTLLLAVREHDNGWREADAAPRIDLDTGGPADFRSYPREERQLLWRRAVERLADRPHAAALVAHHAKQIHRRCEHPGWIGFRAEMAEQRDRLAAAAGLDATGLDADYRWLDLGDKISLAACGALAEADCRGYRVHAEGSIVAIDPFPLAGSTTFTFPARTIEDRRYEDAVDLATRLAATRWSRQTVRVIPAPA